MSQDDPKLIPNANWQTKQRGSNDQEYQIYRDLSGDVPLKTYDEWLNS